MRRMDRYKDEEEAQSRIDLNQELYQNVSNNTIYANITDVTNANAFEIQNGNNIQNFKNNKNIIIMDLNVKNSIDGGHLCNIIKKNNKFYHYSDNYYIECDENDVINNNFDKILEDYNKVGLHTFYKPSINSIIIICK